MIVCPKSTRKRTCLLLLFALLLAAGPGRTIDRGDAAEPRIDFNRQVRAILSDRCFHCHGPDEKNREAGLRLDERSAALEDVGSGAVIVPGDPDASVLIHRVIELDDDLRMPPAHSKKPSLTAQEVQTLRQWIAEGAHYQPHWAFAPLQRPAAPITKDTAWGKNAIDPFIVGALENVDLAPSPPADRATLLRRVHLDLTGLLPRPSEIADFQNDTRPDAYERVVDALLVSPHYGERWGRHWLDQARYADSNGYSIDSVRSMWPYRDWVLRAVNDDMPFDQFTIEQLAGDLLPNASKLQRIASGFHRNTLINQEGGTDPEQFRHEAVVDRVNTTGAVWLGLTLGCAQCHTHKYDPITDREYYELFAFFNSGTDRNNTGATVSVLPGEVLGTTDAAAVQRQRQQRRKWEAELLQELSFADSEHSLYAQTEWREFGFSADNAIQTSENRDNSDVALRVAGQPKVRLLQDGSWLIEGKPAANADYRLTLPLQSATLSGLRLQVLADDRLPQRGPGRAGNGNFVLTSVRLLIDGEAYVPGFAVADHEQPQYPVAAAIDTDPKTGWAINVAPGSQAIMNADHQAVFVFDPPLRIRPSAAVVLELRHDANPNYQVGRFAVQWTDAALPYPTMAAPKALVEALKKSPDKRSAAQRKQVLQGLRDRYPRVDFGDEPPEPATTMVMAELPEPRPTYVSVRGDFLRPDEQVGRLRPGVLAAVPPALPDDASGDRLDLARWLVDAENPLTPRVTVNRVWMKFFGSGLVETEEDFGSQGTLPSHPELLDFLATRFQSEGYSLKRLHRWIVTSATYRQASAFRNDTFEVDPRNRLLSRQNRLRVEAEIIRDAALSASGQLDRRIGGPSVYPPQPDGVYAFTQTSKSWRADQHGNRFRRSLYTQFFRSAPHPLFTTFDTPDMQTTCTRRNRSNTPLQALTIANDPMFLELADAFGQRILRDTTQTRDFADKLKHAFLLTMGRVPSEQEMAVLADYWDSVPQGQATSLNSETRNTARPSDNPDAWSRIGRVLMNTDNFITRE